MRLNLFIFLMLFFCPFVYSYSASDVALDFTYLSNQIDLMKQNNLSVVRVNDELYLAKSYFIDEKLNNPNFELTKSKIDEIKSLINLAYVTNLDYEHLYQNYLDNKTILSEDFYDEKLYDIELDLNAGRYELASEKILYAEENILAANSFQSRTILISKVIGKGIFDFIKDYYYILLIIIFLPVILFLIFKKKICHIITNRRKKRLYLKKEVILSLMKKLQEDYFVKNNISETSYKIKLARYSEIEKDIEKDIAKCDETLCSLR